MSKSFREPTDLADCLAMRDELTLAVKGMDLLLADRNAVDENGNRMNHAEYWAWRQRKLAGKMLLERRLTYLKTWRRKYQEVQDDHWNNTPIKGVVTLDCGVCSKTITLEAKVIREVGLAVLSHYLEHE